MSKIKVVPDLLGSGFCGIYSLYIYSLWARRQILALFPQLCFLSWLGPHGLIWAHMDLYGIHARYVLEKSFSNQPNWMVSFILLPAHNSARTETWSLSTNFLTFSCPLMGGIWVHMHTNQHKTPHINQYSTLFYKNIYDLLKSWNVHTNTFHASNPAIVPYNVKNQGCSRFLGFGILWYLFPIYTLWACRQFSSNGDLELVN